MNNKLILIFSVTGLILAMLGCIVAVKYNSGIYFIIISFLISIISLSNFVQPQAKTEYKNIEKIQLSAIGLTIGLSVIGGLLCLFVNYISFKYNRTSVFLYNVNNVFFVAFVLEVIISLFVLRKKSALEISRGQKEED